MRMTFFIYKFIFIYTEYQGLKKRLIILYDSCDGSLVQLYKYFVPTVTSSVSTSCAIPQFLRYGRQKSIGINILWEKLPA